MKIVHHVPAHQEFRSFATVSLSLSRERINDQLITFHKDLKGGIHFFLLINMKIGFISQNSTITSLALDV